MEVAILQPYDCLKRQNHHHHHHQRRPLISGPTKPRRTNNNLNLSPSPSPNPNPTSNPRSNRRRRNSPPPSQPNKAQQTRPNTPPFVGQVRILKRGEQISLPTTPPQPAPAPAPVKAAGSTGRGLPGPMLNGFYAGSAFVTSPAPSEVPLPAFFTRTRNCGGDAHNQEIACELRKVLKLC